MICTHMAQYFASESLCWGSFLVDFCQKFWLFLKNSPAILWAERPDILQSLQIFFLISKEYSTTILDVGETSKSFDVNIRGFWDLVFFLFSLQNFPMEKPSQNEQKNQNFNFIIKYFWRWCMFKMLLKVFSSCFLSKINVFSYGYHFSTKKIYCSTIRRISSKLA